MTDWKSLSYVVVDVEGNGQQPPDLVELAAMPIPDGIIGVPRSWLVRPDRPITHFARKIHGITNEDSLRLGNLVAAFDLAAGLDPELRPHRATYDVLVTARLFVQLAGQLTLEELRDQPDDAQVLF